jgi:WD40 repeat protein
MIKRWIALFPMCLLVSQGVLALPTGSPPTHWHLLDQTAHEGPVSEIYQVRAAGLIYSSGQDGHLKVWRAKDGLELADLVPDDGRRIVCMAVSPNDSNVVAVSTSDTYGNDGAIAIVNIESGRVTLRWEATAHHLAFSHDGTYLAGKSFSSVTVWMSASGRVYVGLQGGSEDSSKVQFVGTDTLVFHADEGVVFLKLATGAVTKIVTQGTTDFFAFEAKRRLATSDNGVYREWDLSSGTEALAVATPRDTDRLIADDVTGDVYLMPRGRYLMGEVHGPIFRVAGGTHKVEGLVGGDAENVFTALQASAGELLSGNFAGRLRHWRFESEKLKVLAELGVSRPSVSAISVSRDGRYIAVGDLKGAVDIWDSNYNVRRTFDPFASRPKPCPRNNGSNGLVGVCQSFVFGSRKVTPKVVALSFLRNNDLLSVVYSSGDVRVVSAKSLQVVFSDTYDGKAWPLFAFTNASDELYMVTRVGIGHWALSDGKRLPNLATPASALSSTRFFATKTAFGVYKQKSVELLDLATASSRSIDLPGEPVCVLSDDDTIVAVSATKLTRVSASGSRSSSISSWPINAYVRDCALVSKTVVLVADDGRVVRIPYDMDTAQALDARTTRSVPLATCAIVTNGYVLVGSSNGLVHFLDPDSGSEKARLISWEEDGWAVLKDNTQFAAPPESWPRLVFSPEGAPLSSLDQGLGFRRWFHASALQELLVPALGKHIARTSDEKLLSLRGSPPRVKLLEPLASIDVESGSGQAGIWSVSSVGKTIDVPYRQAGDPRQTVSAVAPIAPGVVHVRAQVDDTGGGVRDCRLARNHEVVKFPTSPTKGTIEADLTIGGGDSELEVYCFDNSGVGSAHDSTLITAKDSVSPVGTAYIIGIGIDSYPNDPLHYAVSDAKLVMLELKKSLETTNRYRKVLPIPLLEKDATRSNVIAVLKRLSGASVSVSPGLLASDQAGSVGPDDAVIFYFAGHGGMMRGAYRLSTFQAQGAADSLSDEDLRELFGEINARDLMVILDACESGAVLGEDLARIGPFDSRSFAQMAYDKGIFVLLASQESAAAREPEALKHGLMTYFLINQGLKNSRASDSPGLPLSVRDFINYPISAVPAWQEETRFGTVADEPTRLTMVGGKPVSPFQIPQVFVPFFGYNEGFVIGAAVKPSN